MVRIAHIAIKVSDIPPASAFLERVFGFTHTGTIVHPATNFSKQGRGGGHVSRHLSDGAMDLTLVQYDDEATAEPGSSARPGPCIHHFGIEASDLDALAGAIARSGGRVMSEAGLPTVKFRAPGGTMSEVVPEGWFSQETIAANAERRRRGLAQSAAATARQPDTTPDGSRTAEVRPRISHMTIDVENVDEAAAFYRQAFGFRPFAIPHERDHRSVHLTDGAFDLAINYCVDARTDAARAAGAGPCIHHIGIDVPQEEMEGYARRIREHGCEFIDDPGAATLRFRMPGGGSLAEIAPSGWRFRTQA